MRRGVYPQINTDEHRLKGKKNAREINGNSGHHVNRKALIKIIALGLCFLPVGCFAQERLTVDSAVSEALQNSPQAKAILKERDAKRVGIDREKPVARPTADAKLSGTLQGNPVRFPRPDGSQATFLPDRFLRLELNIEQIVYRPGIGAARRRYASQLVVADEETRKAQGELALAVTKAFFDMLKAEAGVVQARDGLAFALRYRVFVEGQITAGVAKPVDLETVKAQVSEAEAAQVTATNGAILAKMNLNRLLGRPLEAEVNLSSTSQTVAPDNDLKSATETALKRRPEIRLIDANLIGTKEGAFLAKTQAQPSMIVRGQAAEQTPTALLPETYYAVTFEVRIPIFDGGKAKSESEEARIQGERLLALREEAISGIKIEVMQASLQRTEAKAKSVSASAKVKSAEATLRVAEKAYEVGRGTLIEVQNARRELETALTLFTRTTYDEVLLAEALYRHVQGLDVPESPASAPKKAGKKSK